MLSILPPLLAWTVTTVTTNQFIGLRAFHFAESSTFLNTEVITVHLSVDSFHAVHCINFSSNIMH